MYQTRRQAPLVLLLSITALLTPSCISPKRTPSLDRIFAEVRSTTGKRPIIVIPGILGTQLINSKTGAIIWPSALRSSDEDTVLPMTPDLAANHDSVVPGKIIETLRLARALPEVYVYKDLLEALKKYGGYSEGDWNNPPVTGYQDTFYVFAYDWRRDNVESARELVRRIHSLKEKLGHPDLRFNILAHSMGGLIARYAAMYGDNDLPTGEAEPHPSWAGAPDINKIIMLGVPNEGSADAFATLIDGYSITEGLRRRIPLLNKLTAEDAATAPAIFQLLPHGSVAKFLDEDLKPLKINIYDPDTWKRYGWSIINDAEYRRRYERPAASAHAAKAGRSLAELDAYLAAVLSRAHRFHQALDAVSTGEETPVALLAIGGDCEETLDSPIVLRDQKQNRWVTLIRPRTFPSSSGHRISQSEVIAAMFSPGDGRVTRRSLLGQDLPGKRRAGAVVDSPLPVTYALFVCDLHGALQRNKTLQDNALTMLIAEAIR